MFLPIALAALSQLVHPVPLVCSVPGAFEFKDGDRVVWIGSTLVEREQRYGYWETALLAANPGKKITFRNLGWSGDTVHAEARGRFDFAIAEKCFKQLVDQTLELKPTVIFVSYGTNESFEGKDGLPKFEKGLVKLLDALKPADARVVLFTPMPFESGPGFTERNKQMEAYAAVIRQTAKARGTALADLFADIDEVFHMNATSDPARPPALTENGMHLREAGYRGTADDFIFTITATRPKLDWKQLESLRQAVLAKNEQFFNKWRPQNETYLTGFRQHEQGKNAKEVAEFDPFIAKLEAEIEKLRKALN